MNYNEALKYIEGTGKFGINLGLQRVMRLCELLGNPEKKLKVIHIAGTNGKGSTATFISSVLINAGYRVGIYTSPYIERFTERIKINKDEIPEAEVARLVTEIKPSIERVSNEGLGDPTEFEIITACAFKYFEEQGVDFVVLEVGLGGRYDATNVVDPILSVITSISYDHVHILGDTLGKIAYEKAGIIKEGRPVVIYPQEKEAMEVIKEVAEAKGAKIYHAGDLGYEIVKNTIEGIEYKVSCSNKFKNIKISILGEHQILNSLTALKSIEILSDLGYKINDTAVYDGLESASWPGRFEVLKREPYIVLDGGHNLQGIESLVNACKSYFKDKKINIVCGMLRDKNYMDMVKLLLSIGNKFITVEPLSPRAMTAVELKGVIEENNREAMAAKNINEAVKVGIEITKEDEVLIFCGSLYMIGEARKILKEINIF